MNKNASLIFAISFVFFVFLSPSESSAQVCCSTGWSTRTVCTTDSMAGACPGPSSCGAYVCPLYCYCTTETYCAGYLYDCSPPPPPPDDGGSSGGDCSAVSNVGCWCDCTYACDGCTCDPECSTSGGGSEPTSPPPPPPTATPTPVVNPTDLAVNDFYLSDKNGTKKNAFLPGETAYSRVSITNTGNEWPQRTYTPGVYIYSLEGRVYKDAPDLFYRSPQNQIPGITYVTQFVTDTSWEGDAYATWEAATRRWGSYPGGLREVEFTTKTFTVPTAPGNYTARFIIDPDDKLMETWSPSSIDSSCSNEWCRTNFANNQFAYSYTVVGGDLVVDELILVDQNGVVKGSTSNPFLTSDKIYPKVTIRNGSTGTAVSSDDQTDSRIYPHLSTPPTTSTATLISMLNGEFQSNDTYTYYCRPDEPDNRCWAFNNEKYWSRTNSGTYNAWIWVNYNKDATETNYDNNTRNISYTVVQSYQVQGKVYIDNNQNKIFNTGESGVADAIITLHSSNGIQLQSKTTDSSGNYTFDPVIQGNYQIRIFSSTNLADYNFTTPQTIDIVVGPDSLNNNFSLYPKYAISGLVYIDENGNKVKESSEQNYEAVPNISITPSGGPIQISENANGTYSIIGLTSRSYTVSYTSVPSGYYVSHPRNGPPPSFSATVGSGCTEAIPNPGGSCTNGNLQNLNFGIKEGEPWIQAYGLDVRFDTGVNNPLPPTPNAACGGAYAMRPATNPTIPGILFTGNASARLGEGQAAANPYNWIVGGNIYPELFTPVNTNIIKTAYGAMQTSLRQSGQTPINLSTVCTLSNCTLPANLPEGVYQASQDVALQGYTFPTGRDYIFLIDGDLTIWGNLDVPIGSTATYSTSGDIRVVASVGQAAASCPAPANAQIDGFFSSDKNFHIASSADCAENQPDKQLHIQGAIVVNAGQLGGRFINDRTLCTSNISFPIFTIKERPDMILNTPDLMRSQNVIYQEIAP